MATVYLVRKGCGNERTSQGRDVCLVNILNAFPNTKLVWSVGAPTFNPDLKVNHVSAYYRVVVHVQASEKVGKFDKDGFWTLDNVSPSEFHQKFPVAT